jgi:hypothetical protein
VFHLFFTKPRLVNLAPGGWGHRIHRPGSNNSSFARL